MSKLLASLFLVVVVTVIGGAVVLAFTDVPVEQDTIENTVTYSDFKAKNNS